MVYEKIRTEINKIKQNGINETDFIRIKKMIYGDYVKEYNDVSDIARMFLSDYFKGVNSFDYLEEIETIYEQYIESILKNLFKEDKMVISVVRA